MTSDETYEFDIEEGWTEQPESGMAGGHKPNGGGQSSPPPTDAAWPIPDPAMFHGLAGEVVATIIPNTEADAVALLVNYHAYFGNIIGRGPFFKVGETDHFTNLNGVLVGETSSRKGTAADRVTAIFRLIDLEWVQRKTGGMSSGEGLIHEIRDPIFVMKGGKQQLSDPGVIDKRQMIEETEFSQVLAVMQRDGNNLSRMLRDAWDCRPVLKTKVRHSPLMVTNPFISITAHITPDELRKKLDELAYFNGFANRFLFVCVQRSKEIPDEGHCRRKCLYASPEPPRKRLCLRGPWAAWNEPPRRPPCGGPSTRSYRRSRRVCLAQPQHAQRRRWCGCHCSMPCLIARQRLAPSTSPRHWPCGGTARTRHATSSSRWSANTTTPPSSCAT